MKTFEQFINELVDHNYVPEEIIQAIVGMGDATVLQVADMLEKKFNLSKEAAGEAIKQYINSQIQKA